MAEARGGFVPDALSRAGVAAPEISMMLAAARSRPRILAAHARSIMRGASGRRALKKLEGKAGGTARSDENIACLYFLGAASRALALAATFYYRAWPRTCRGERALRSSARCLPRSS